MDQMEIKTFEQWCLTEGDLFVFKDEFLKYLQGKDSRIHKDLEMAYWNFALAWSNFYRNVISKQLDGKVEELGSSDNPGDLWPRNPINS
jgi:hypothetical protein